MTHDSHQTDTNTTFELRYGELLRSRLPPPRRPPRFALIGPLTVQHQDHQNPSDATGGSPRGVKQEVAFSRLCFRS